MLRSEGWELYLLKFNDLLKQYGATLETSHDLQVEVPRAQGAMQALGKIHNEMLDLKNENLEEKNG